MCRKIFTIAKMFEPYQNVYENKLYKIGQDKINTLNKGTLHDICKNLGIDNLTFEIKNFVSEMEFDVIIKLYKGNNLFRENFLHYNIKNSLGLGYDTELVEIVPKENDTKKELLGTLDGKEIYLQDMFILKSNLEDEILNKYVDTVHLYFYKNNKGNLTYKGFFVRENGEYVPKYLEYGFTDEEIINNSEDVKKEDLLSPATVYLDPPSQYIRYLLKLAI